MGEFFKWDDRKMCDFKSRLESAVQHDEFMDVAHQLYCDNYEKHELLAQDVASLHNEGLIDVVSEFIQIKSKTGGKGHCPFQAGFIDALPSINASVSVVMRALQPLAVEDGKNVSQPWLSESFVKFCFADATRPEQALSIALSEIDEYFAFISMAVQTGSKLDMAVWLNQAIALSKSDDVRVQSEAIHALGKIEYGQEVQLISMAFEAIEIIATERDDDLLLATALKAIFSIYQKGSESERDTLRLSRLILDSNKGDCLTHAAAQVFAYDRDKLTEEMIDLLLAYLAQVNPENVETMNIIDYPLKLLIQGGSLNKVIVFLRALQNIQISLSLHSCLIV
jgi:hypothetical protein